MEYEYSFEVDSLDKYIKYCDENNYKLIEKTDQNRTLYRKKEDKTLARIAIKDKTKMFLDFKDDVLLDQD